MKQRMWLAIATITYMLDSVLFDVILGSRACGSDACYLQGEIASAPLYFLPGSRSYSASIVHTEGTALQGVF